MTTAITANFNAANNGSSPVEVKVLSLAGQVLCFMRRANCQPLKEILHCNPQQLSKDLRIKVLKNSQENTFVF